MWADNDQTVAMIDHNLAFESPVQEIRSEHVFAQAVHAWDAVFFCEWPQRLAAAAATIPQIWDQMPDIWAEEGSRVLTLERVREQLLMYTDPRDPAWNIP